MNQSSNQLRSFIERIERVEEEKKALADDIKDIYAEAKSHGFDTKVIRTIVKRRSQDQNKVAEFEALFETYMAEIDKFSSTPLGAHADKSKHQEHISA